MASITKMAKKARVATTARIARMAGVTEKVTAAKMSRLAK